MKTKIGILKLIEVKKQPEPRDLLICIEDYKNDKGITIPKGKIHSSFFSLFFRGNTIKYWRVIEPIIVCDEEIKVNDKVYVAVDNAIVRVDTISDPLSGYKEKRVELYKDDNYFGTTNPPFCQKILVLPEQFSPIFNKFILDGTIKDGDKVGVLYDENNEPCPYLDSDLNKQTPEQAAKDYAERWAKDYRDKTVRILAFRAGVEWAKQNLK